MSSTKPISDIPDDLVAAQNLAAAAERIAGELSRVVVGQREVIEQLLIALAVEGHCLLVGVPGLAKTLLIRTLAETLALKFGRIQFTPDLMPADITGTEMIQENKTTGTRDFRFSPGPIFNNLLLADEINRTPPKTQAALLEAMQERRVTVYGRSHDLPRPFFVLATQNPIEQEGTYPLPEAQLDRFMFMIEVGYPNEDEELEIVKRTTSEQLAHAAGTTSCEELLALMPIVRRIPISDPLLRRVLKLIRLTRPNSPDAPDFVKQYVRWGAGPRGGQNLVLAAKARAALRGRILATGEDVTATMLPALRHRLVLNFHAEADGVTPDSIIEKLWKHLEHTEQETNGRGPVAEVFRSERTR